MQITDICIRRPVFAIVLNIMLMLLGVIAYKRLPVREYPKISEPIVTVSTTYSGANAEIVESQITKPLEDALAGIEGVETITSISRQELSQISIRFKLSRDPDNAAADVRDRVSRTRGNIPKDAQEPIISKVEADAYPILYLAFFSNRHSQMELTDFADRHVKDLLQNLNGVANVEVIGERRIAMRIWLQPQEMNAFSITTQDIIDALVSQNVQIPAGLIDSASSEFTILSKTNLATPEEFNNIIIKQKGDALIRLKDIGNAVIAPADNNTNIRFNGQEAIALGIIKQAIANPLEVSKEVTALLPQIRERLPPGMQIDLAYDSAVFIEHSINAVYHALLEAFVLVILVIFLFLRNIRSTLIPVITIPISLIGTFMIMYLFNFSINTLTLLALVLAIGLVVDDAIVMLENIYRHMEEGMDRLEAAFKGSQEIAFAIVVMTLTLAAVYAPVAFIQARTGKLFIEFALTLAGSVIISGFIALTLSPMMCSRLLKYEKKHNKFYNFIENGIHRIHDRYAQSLDWALTHTTFIIVIALLIAAVGAYFFKLLPSELSPTEDRGAVFIIAQSPEGSTIDYTSYWVQQLEPYLSSVPEIEKYFVIAGVPNVSQGMAFAPLKNWNQRKLKQQTIVDQLQPKFFYDIPGILAFPLNLPSLGSTEEQAISFIIQTTGTYKELSDVVERFVHELEKNPKILNINIDLKMNKPEISVNINRNKAAAMGIHIDTIGKTLETLFSPKKVTRFEESGNQYDVILQVAKEERQNPGQILETSVRTPKGKMVKLSNLVTLDETVAPRELNHFNQLRAATISANTAPGYSLGDALKFFEDVASKTLPSNMQTNYSGESREYKTSGVSLIVTFILAIFFIYLVLAAQFESFINPLIIMLTVPLSMAGALLALYLTGGTLNIYSQIGLITLIGLITKHGILIIEFSNQLEHQGHNVFDAIKEACNIRLRPILMTTGAMVLGAVPLAIATGAGAESRNQIGWVIIGGMTLGTLFTLFIIPSIYVAIRKPKSSFSTPDTTL